MPRSRRAASLARRSAIRWFSSAGATAVVSLDWLMLWTGRGAGRAWVLGGPARVAAGPVVGGGCGRGSARGAAAAASGRVGPFGADLQAGLEAGLDELVQVAVQHLLGIAALDAGAQVLDPALVEHVVADLAAPADVGLGGLHRVLLGVALLQLQLVQLGRQHLHRAVAVGVLAALGLAGHHDAA